MPTINLSILYHILAGVTQLQSTSTTTTTVSPYTVSVNQSPNVTSTPSPNNKESLVQMGLVLAVAGLLVMSIILTCILIVLLLIKCCRRAAYMAAKANRIQGDKIQLVIHISIVTSQT